MQKAPADNRQGFRFKGAEAPPSRNSSSELQVPRRGLAALGEKVVADLLALHQRRHAGALHGRNVDEHVLAAIARLNEAKAFLRIEELHGP